MFSVTRLCREAMGRTWASVMDIRNSWWIKEFLLTRRAGERCLKLATLYLDVLSPMTHKLTPNHVQLPGHLSRRYN